VRSSTSDAPPPSFPTAPPPLGCVLRVFRPLNFIDVVAVVRALPDKQCGSDMLPTRVLKDNVDALAPRPTYESIACANWRRAIRY